MACNTNKLRHALTRKGLQCSCKCKEQIIRAGGDSSRARHDCCTMYTITRETLMEAYLTIRQKCQQKQGEVGNGDPTHLQAKASERNGEKELNLREEQKHPE